MLRSIAWLCFRAGDDVSRWNTEMEKKMKIEMEMEINGWRCEAIDKMN